MAPKKLASALVQSTLVVASTAAKGALGSKRTRAEAATDVDAPEDSVPAPAIRVATAASAAGGLAALLPEAWRTVLATTIHDPYFAGIERFLASNAAGSQVFPPRDQIFSAFKAVEPSKVKVVLIGQDPYHDVGQAHGLCFSVLPGIKPPPSLVNMYKELATDIPGFVAPSHGYLMSWAKQGVLMLNATLTVEAHKPNSHAKCGWQKFTDDVISTLDKQPDRLVFLLWGGFAQKKGAKIDRKKHIVIEVAHPSPLSVKLWWGCKTFSKCNAALESLGKAPIDWRLPNHAEVETSTTA